MGRTQDEKRLFLLGPHPRNIPRMISRLHRFLERGILFAVDPDQTDAIERKEHGGSRANHDGNMVLPNPLPDVSPLLVRHHAVKGGGHRRRMSQRGSECFRTGGFARDHEHLPSEFHRPDRGSTKQGEAFCRISLHQQTCGRTALHRAQDARLPFDVPRRAPNL